MYCLILVKLRPGSFIVLKKLPGRIFRISSNRSRVSNTSRVSNRSGVSNTKYHSAKYVVGHRTVVRCVIRDVLQYALVLDYGIRCSKSKEVTL